MAQTLPHAASPACCGTIPRRESCVTRMLAMTSPSIARDHMDLICRRCLDPYIATRAKARRFMGRNMKNILAIAALAAATATPALAADDAQATIKQALMEMNNERPEGNA